MREDRRVRSGLVMPAAMTALAVTLAWLTTRLPFTAGSPLVDLGAPLGALVGGVVGSRLAFRRRRDATGRARVVPSILGILGALIAVAAVLMLVLILGLCGAYWTQTSC